MKRNLCIFTTKKLLPPEDGRADTIYKRILLFQKLDYSVTIVSFVKQNEDFKKLFDVIEIQVPIRFSSALIGIVKKYPLQVLLYSNMKVAHSITTRLGDRRYDIVITDMARTALLAKSIPAAIRILDMDDILSRRYLAQVTSPGATLSIGKSPIQITGRVKIFQELILRLLLRYEAYAMELFEYKMSKEYHKTVLVSQKEAEHLKSLTGEKNIYSIPNYIEFPVKERNSNIHKDIDIIFFGNLSTAHNIDTIQYLVEKVFPPIIQVIPMVKICIVGRNATTEITEVINRCKNITLLNDVEYIASFIERAKLCLTPMRFGSGIKTKILEALYLGTPVVTNNTGADGIPNAANCMFIANSLEDQIQLSIGIINGSIETEPIIQQAKQMVQENFSETAVLEKLKNLVLIGD